MESKKVKVFNKETNESQEAILLYEYHSYDNSYVKIIFNDIIEECIQDNYFKALREIRLIIYPWIPMVKGALINAISRGNSIVYIVELGKKVEEKDIVCPFKNCSDKINLVHPYMQDIYFTLWKNKNNSKYICEKYNISKEYICIEKTLKLNKKVENNNDHFFLIYDTSNGKLFDIKNLRDLEVFKKNTLQETGNSLKKLLIQKYPIQP